MEGSALTLARRYAEAGVTDLYVADLDAIAGRATNEALVGQLSDLGPPVWLDAGASSREFARDCIEHGASRVIVGLETLTSFDALQAICEDLGGDRVAFSLDLRNGLPITRELAERFDDAVVAAVQAAAAGVRAIIVLDVARVGTSRGIDFALVRRVRESAPDVMVLAGGGLRGADDLARLEAAGGDGALIATAFHDGILDRSQIIPYTSREHRTSNLGTEPAHEPGTWNPER